MKNIGKIILFIISGLLLILFGVGLKTILTPKQPIQNPVVIIDTVQEGLKITELKDSIRYKEQVIDNLKREIEKTKAAVIILKDELKELPLTENMIRLRTNLENYEGISDSLPNLYVLEEIEDTLITITEKNLIDINSAFLDLSADSQIIANYQDIIYQDSLVINLCNSINLEKDNIIAIQDSTYKSEIYNLQQNILIGEKKTKAWKTTTLISSTAAIILGGILLWQQSK